MQRGEIWSVALPFASGGREQSGQRPAIIVQDSFYGQGSPLVLAIPLTSQTGAQRFPGTVAIDSTEENGLTLPSVAMVFQLRALGRSRFVRRLGNLSEEHLQEVFTTLDRLTGRMNKEPLTEK